MKTKWALLLGLALGLGLAVAAGLLWADPPPDPPPDPLGPLGLDGGPLGPGPGMGPGRGMGPAGQGMERRKEQIEQIKKNDPERYKRLVRIRELALEYRTTSDERRKKEIEKELRPLVDQELRIQHEENKKRVAWLEQRLAEMKKILKQREEHWSEVVDYTIKEITGQNNYLKAWPGAGWGRGPRKR